MRFFLRKVHLWLGLTLGFFWALQGLTGGLLVFHRHFDHAGDGPLTDGPMAPISELLSVATQSAGQPIQRITAVGPDIRLLEARYNDAAGKPQALRLDAATAHIVGAREREPTSPFTGSSWRWLYLVHISLMAGVAGRYFIGISGLFLLITVGAGLWMAWPKAGAWKSAFAFSKWRSPFQIAYGWHRAVGLTTALVLFVLTVSGSYMVFATKLAPLLARTLAFSPIAALGHQMAPATNQAETHEFSADQALAMAYAHFPQGKFMNFEMPVEHPGYYSIRLTLPGEWRVWAGRATMQVDAVTGEMIAMYDPTHVPMLNRLDDAAYPVHKGEAGGWLGRIIAALAGLFLPVSYGTGLYLWLRKRRKSRERALESAIARA